MANFYRYFVPILFAESINQSGETLGLTSFSGILGIIISAPFLWAIIFGRPSSNVHTQDLIRLKSLVLGIFLTRLTIATGLIAYFLNLFSPLASVFGLIILITISILIFSSRRLAESIYVKLEARFLEHLGKPENEVKGINSS